MRRNDARDVWNRACSEGGGRSAMPGDRALADLLYAHGLVTNGGVDHALECLTPDELSAGISGFEYFLLPGVAIVFEQRAKEVLQGGSGATGESEVDRRYSQIVQDDETLYAQFVSVFVKCPEAFGPTTKT